MKTSPSCVTANATKRFPIGLAFPFRFALTALALGMMACGADDTHVKTGGPTTTGNESGGASGSSSEGGTSGAPGIGGTAGDYSGNGGKGGAGGAGDSGGALDGGGDSGRCASREVRIVAHQDDELLFMNPDLLESLRAGHCVRTVYLTAGDAGKGMAYAMTRDLGMRAVYAEMAVAADVWTETQAAFANKSVLISTLQGTDVSLVFLRLPDGGDGTGFPATGQQSLTKLVAGSIAAIGAVDNSNSFTRGELVMTLAQLIADYGADLVAIQEFADEFGGDHPDHIAGGVLANEAQTKFASPHRVLAYRGYDTVALPANLSGAVADENWKLFLDYGKHDENVCPGGVCPALGRRPTARVLGLYYDWCRQQFPYFKGSIVGFGGKCLTAQGGSSTTGAAVDLETCSAVDAQRWIFTTSDGHLMALGLCLEPAVDGGLVGTPLHMAACQNVPSQRWTYGQITIGDAGFTTARFVGMAGRCMTARVSSGSTGAGAEIADCVATSPQQGFWYYPAKP
ncbi:MAG TPA: ricin-type beta-trefoil lectin domain protein [Polyangiaceae bacterium]